MLITEKQRKLVRDLSREREVPLRYRVVVDEVLDYNRNLTVAAASELIGILTRQPRRQG